MTINNIPEVNEMTIELVKGTEQIQAVIASISTKSAAYKATVSSAVLSAVQHIRVHGDYTLLQSAMDTVFETNYRDYSAVVEFIKSLTWLGVDMANRGRRQHYSIVGDLVAGLGDRPANVPVKDWTKKVESAKNNIIIRQGLFDNFAQGKGVPMRNPNWTVGMDKELKKENVVYAGDIFKWHDDVKWLRAGTDSDGTGETTPREMTLDQAQKAAMSLEERLLKSSNIPVVVTVTHILERFEEERGVIATEKELEHLEAAFNMFIQRTKVRMDIKKRREQESAQNESAAEENNATE